MLYYIITILGAQHKEKEMHSFLISRGGVGEEG